MKFFPHFHWSDEDAEIERGRKLKNHLGKQGLMVIEVYLGGTQDILGLTWARRNWAKLHAGLLRKLGLDLGLSLLRPQKPEKNQP